MEREETTSSYCLVLSKTKLNDLSNWQTDITLHNFYFTQPVFQFNFRIFLVHKISKNFGSINTVMESQSETKTVNPVISRIAVLNTL